MKKYRFILIDADNTLLDFNENERVSITDTLAHFGLLHDEETVRLYHEINKSYWKLYDEKKISRDDLLIQRFVTLYEKLGITMDPYETEKYYRTKLDYGFQLITGAIELCDELRKKYKVYITTNGMANTQHLRLNGSGLINHVDGCFISEEIGAHKPEKEYFDRIARQLDGFKAEEAIVIGDSFSSDILGGINAGIDTCWYNPYKAENLTDQKATYEITSYEELKRILGV